MMRDRILGSLMGGAVGDALGYTVEFDSYGSIVARYGSKGISRYEFNRNGVAEISDDTQMTLFTANGLLNGCKESCDDFTGWIKHITEAYLEWYLTQYANARPNAIENPKCWLSTLPEMFSVRAPGNTCISALNSIMHGYEVYNDSKGCGGIMRVAPIALYGAARGLDANVMAKLGCDAAHITHCHPMGYLPAGVMVYTLQYIIGNKGSLTREDVKNYVDYGLNRIGDIVCSRSGKQYREIYKDYIDSLVANTLRAMDLSESDISDVDAIGQLGHGWTGDEAWYIALYCAMKHFGDFEASVVAAVNHSGDSDSTGAICGNLAGAITGFEAIPDYYKENLELYDVIERMSNDLLDINC